MILGGDPCWLLWGLQLFGTSSEVSQNPKPEHLDDHPDDHYGEPDSFYELELSILPQNRDVILTLLFGDFIREGRHLHLAISMRMSNIFSFSHWFFTHFERQLGQQQSEPLWETTLLTPENPLQDQNPSQSRSPYFHLYGDDSEGFC